MTFTTTTTARDYAEANSIPVGTVRTRLRKSTVEPVDQLNSSGRAHVYRLEDIKRVMQQFSANPRVARTRTGQTVKTDVQTPVQTQSVHSVDSAETLIETLCTMQNMPAEQFRLLAVALVNRYMGA